MRHAADFVTQAYVRPARGMTLIEAVVSVAIIGIVLAVTVEILAATSRHMDTETTDSDLTKRTTGQVYNMIADIENIVASQDTIFQTIGIANQGTQGNPPGTHIPAITAVSETGIPITGSTNASIVGNSITFQIPTGTDANGRVTWGGVVRYRWAPLLLLKEFIFHTALPQSQGYYLSVAMTVDPGLG